MTPQQQGPPPSRQPQHMPFHQQPLPPPPSTTSRSSGREQPQYQPFPQQHYAPPPPQQPQSVEEHHHYYAVQHQPQQPSGPAYGHFAPPPPANERVKVIRGGERRDSDSDGVSVHGLNGIVRKEKRRKVISGRDPYRDRFYRTFTSQREALHSAARALLVEPQNSESYPLRLYPHSLRRAALVSQIELEEEWALESAQTTHDEEKAKVEDEWKRGKERIRERLLEGLEERRKKAREEMASDGVLADAPAFEPPSTTRASNKTSKPPPFVLAAPNPFGAAGEEMMSPFPLPLTAYAGGMGGWSANGRKRQKGVGPTGGLTLGKAIGALTGLKESEIEADLGEVKKAVKRKRRAGQGVAGQYRD